MTPTTSSSGDSHGDALPDAVVSAALDAYARLPKHGKPARRDNGVSEWTVFASILLTAATAPPSPPSTEPAPASACAPPPLPRIIPISLATGVKCLPAARLPPLGDTLHDSHAEVLARRGFVRWLVDEAGRVLRAGREGTEERGGEGVMELRDGMFRLKAGVEVWLYVSALPCGDASTLHTAAHQPPSAAPSSEHEAALSSVVGAARGRSGYANYGAIRTKPGRRDSPASISFSCSDKIASWSVLGLQGGLLRAFAGVWLDHVVVGGVEVPPGEGGREGEWRERVRGEVERALYGRLEGVADALPLPYTLHRPRVHLTPLHFPFDKPPATADGPDVATANTCLLVLPGHKPEVLVNGCVQTSAWKPPGHVLVKDKVRSRACRIEVMRAYVALQRELGGREGGASAPAQGPARAMDAGGRGVGEPSRAGQPRDGAPPEPVVAADTYATLKARNTAYIAAKRVLRGQVGEPVSDEWKLPHTFYATVGDAPFSGWIVAGDRYASFTAAGELRE